MNDLYSSTFLRRESFLDSSGLKKLNANILIQKVPIKKEKILCKIIEKCICVFFSILFSTFFLKPSIKLGTAFNLKSYLPNNIYIFLGILVRKSIFPIKNTNVNIEFFIKNALKITRHQIIYYSRIFFRRIFCHLDIFCRRHCVVIPKINHIQSNMLWSF